MLRSVCFLAVVIIVLCKPADTLLAQGAVGPPKLQEAEAEQTPPYGLSINEAQAKKVIAAARSAAVYYKTNEIAIAVADPSGELVAFVKMDDAAIHSVVYAQVKARGAARLRRATAMPPQEIAAAVSSTPDFVATPGGMPIVANGRTIGAVGISGAEDNDLAIARIAARALKDP